MIVGTPCIEYHNAHLCHLHDVLPKGVMIFHLLWTLLFLKVYGTEDTMVAMVNTSWETL